MELNEIAMTVGSLPQIDDAVKCVKAKISKVVLNGVLDAAKPVVYSAILGKLKRPALIITSTPEKAARLFSEMKLFLPPQGGFPSSSDAAVFPAPDTVPYEKVSPSREITGARLSVLDSLRDNSPKIVVAPVKAVMYKTIPPHIMGQSTIELDATGDTVELDELLKKLVRIGYKRMEMVGEQGEFAVRGGIVDVYPPSMPDPARIEFFGDRIESIRSFDVASQRSKDKMRRIKILPAREVLITEEAKEKASKIKKRTLDLERIAEGEHFEGIEYWAPLLFEGEKRSILDHLHDDYLIALDEGVEADITSEYLMNEAMDVKKSEEMIAEHRGSVPLPEDPYLSFSGMLADIGSRQIIEASSVSYFDHPRFGNKKVISIINDSPGNYSGRIDALARDVKEKIKTGWKVIAASRQAARIEEIFEDHGISAEACHADLSAGISFPLLKLEILTDREIFGERVLRGDLKTASRSGISDSIAVDLVPGDLIVHSNHGIGIYKGLETLDMDSVTQEYLLIEYAEGDRLYVPLYQMGLIQKYSSSGDLKPNINRLGDRGWTMTKEKVKKSIKDMTKEILEVFSAREKQKGFPFPPDDLWQAELEGAFPYEETEDQKRSIKEVKADMESPRPMDRLICGDVGFGKTEVALRAAFKAAAAGKQVAVLVPTTILAQQHFTNFKDRFRPFPIKVEMLSRFRSKKQQQEIINTVRTGGIDVLIGTHRLVQEDIKLKDLGLLIIDEEQRFGVAHKEKLKKMKKTVDVLTLTATPIPRTLYLSLSGVRGISMIGTPPIDRSPVRTYILEWSDAVIKESILRELERNGQIYFIHNSIHDIDKVQGRISDLVPSARIRTAHGRMESEILESTMEDFMARKFDILLCTTIIESGIDIPNVNTIIINNAERFGLADLYQLRGRVGRSAAKAYAYLFYERENLSTGSALERLEAIKEFTSLGSGYKLALRDLEIRGAGNVLGKQQHGHMAEVGFDLYCELLEESVNELKGKSRVAPRDIMIDLKLNAFIPEPYIKDPKQRIAIYRRLNMIDSQQEMEDLKAELKDRFGKCPKEAEELFKVISLKVKAKMCGIKSIKEEKDRAVIEFFKAPPKEILSELAPRREAVSPDRKKIALDLKSMSPPRRFDAIKGQVFTLRRLYDKLASPVGETS